MKLTNLLALPFALVADALSLGQAGITKKIMYNDECEQVKEILKAIIDNENKK